MKALSSSVSSEHDEAVDEAKAGFISTSRGRPFGRRPLSMGVHVGRRRADSVLIVAVVEVDADGLQRSEVDDRYADPDGARRNTLVGGLDAPFEPERSMVASTTTMLQWS